MSRLAKICYLFWLRPYTMSRVVIFSDWDRIPCQELLSFVTLFLIETVYHVKSCYLFWLRPYTMSRVVIFSDWDRIQCQELLHFWLRPYTMSRVVIPCQELLSFLIETVYHVKSCYLFWLRPYTMSRVVIFSDWDRIPCQELLSFLIETM